MNDKKYYCDECKKELSVSMIRLQQMINASYDLKIHNNKLIKFIKRINSFPNVYWYDESNELLKEIERY